MFLLLSAALASAPLCPVERARYVLRDDPGISASFVAVESGEHWPSRLALSVRSRRTDAVSWWLPWSGGTSNLHHITSTTDVTAPGWRPPGPDDGPGPYGRREYLGFDSGYNVIPRAPQAGRPAPAHFLIPNAGSSGDHVFASRQMFDLIGCSRPGG